MPVSMAADKKPDVRCVCVLLSHLLWATGSTFLHLIHIAGGGGDVVGGGTEHFRPNTLFEYAASSRPAMCFIKYVQLG